MQEPIWTPSRERIGASRLRRFMETVGIGDYERLHRWSVDCPVEFWQEVWDFVGILGFRSSGPVAEGLGRMPGCRWFPGARLNFAENLLRFRDHRPALVSWTEGGRQRSVTFRDLYLEVGAMAASLERAGVGRGDRVAGYLPNIPEAIVAMLATTSLGAVWSSCSPDFGTEAVVDRLEQVRPRLLVAADGYRYAGRSHDCLGRLGGIVRAIRSIRKVVVIPFLGPSVPLDGFPAPASEYRSFLARPQAPRFVALPFDHPVCILFSSGTTGAPKCIVHGAGGTLIQHLKEHVLHVDLSERDRLFYFTSCGWMMWNWLASALATGSTLVLYDGSPLHPHPGQLFDMTDSEGVTVFGTSPRYLREIQRRGLVPRASHSLATLRSVLSTGSPLAPGSFDFVYRAVSPDVLLASISGGTDIVSCFALSNPLGPVYRGELQVPGLGMDVEVFSEEGRPLPPGERGELVCTRPFPSMPLGFWNDPDGRRYRDTYFARFPGIWHHGDYCERTASGGFRIWGRSDSVLNPGGVRIGTAEIYAAVESLEEVSEALAVGFRTDWDERIVLFVRLVEGHSMGERLETRVRDRVRCRTSPRHVPSIVLQVTDIPRTRSGKIAERAAKDVIHGRAVKNLHALANPASLDALRSAWRRVRHSA